MLNIDALKENARWTDNGRGNHDAFGWERPVNNNFQRIHSRVEIGYHPPYQNSVGLNEPRLADLNNNDLDVPITNNPFYVLKIDTSKENARQNNGPDNTNAYELETPENKFIWKIPSGFKMASTHPIKSVLAWLHLA